MSSAGASIEAGLAALGVKRLLLAIHDVSFPSDPDEDLGRGSPATRAAARLFGFARALGFTGIQLGPQGQTSRDNPSPYDGTIFSRHLGTIALDSFRPGGAFAGLASAASIERALVRSPGGHAEHQHAYDAIHALVGEAYAAFEAGARPDLVAPFDELHRVHAAWLRRDSLYAAFSEHHRGASFRDWPGVEARAWSACDPEERAQIEAFAEAHRPALRRYGFGQLLAHAEHARVRARCAELGLTLYGDLQVGYSDCDAWAYANAFLDDYLMGAPPSRTNPDGQPWGYPVLDPAQYRDPASSALGLVHARFEKGFAEYDSLRIDHPHGLVCPWVYRARAADPAHAVRDGARLHESPDLPDHPALAAFAIARADQLDRASPRYADAWVTDLDDAQVARYSRLFDILAAAATRHGRSLSDLSCEVLSTMPMPLRRVLERHQLGRWRVLQKADLDDDRDVYRSENAAPSDWVMLGNHDTAPIFALIPSWSPATREAWARHLTQRLSLDAPTRDRLATDDGLVATAMLAELFASRAENVSIFFADLFGYTDRFNAPGTISAHNWSLRLPPSFDALYRDRLAHRAALDLPLAIALARATRA